MGSWSRVLGVELEWNLGVNFLESFLLSAFLQFSFLKVFEVKNEQHKKYFKENEVNLETVLVL